MIFKGNYKEFLRYLLAKYLLNADDLIQCKWMYVHIFKNETGFNKIDFSAISHSLGVYTKKPIKVLSCFKLALSIKPAGSHELRAWKWSH